MWVAFLSERFSIDGSNGRKRAAADIAAIAEASLFEPIPGQEYDINYIRSRTNSRASPLSPLYESTLAIEPWNGRNAHLIFKFEPSSWNYAWRSNKHRQNMLHVCRTYVFRITERELNVDLKQDPDFSSHASSSSTAGVTKVEYITHIEPYYAFRNQL